MMPDIKTIKGVGAATLSKLLTLNITDFGALLAFLPSRYVDLHSPVKLSDVEPGQTCAIEGAAFRKEAPEPRGRRRFSVFLRQSEEAGGRVFKATFFNQPYLFSSFEEGASYRFLGRAASVGAFELVNPIFERADKLNRLQGVFTVYPLKGLIGQTVFKNVIREALKQAESAFTQSEMRSVYEAFYGAHFPTSAEDAEKHVSLLAALDLAAGIKYYRKTVDPSKKCRKVFYNLPKSIIVDFNKALDVAPTPSQSSAFEEIAGDLNSENRMSRIINGDVGSGKTLPAFFAAYAAARAGRQAAVMAPTEILAQQHARKFAKIAQGSGIRYGLLSSSVPETDKKIILQGLKSGDISVVFGTQSLLSDRVEFAGLSLAVIDEQHRFGVAERARLERKGAEDVLALSATPIPRTLALTLFEGIGVSYIRPRREDNGNVLTRVVDDSKIEGMLDYIVSECKKGRQAFIVCPSILDAEGNDAYSIEQFLKSYAQKFGALNFAALHGKLPGAEKSRIMADFSAGRVSILIATSVIEVGVDTSASLMAVLNADRFGLASLHQLRGRIGRDGREAYCFLHTFSCGSKAAERLRALLEENDGLRIAERDFAMRGGGEILGTGQSGAMRTPCLGLPLTPKALKGAGELVDADAPEADFFTELYPSSRFSEFAAGLFNVTLNS